MDGSEVLRVLGPRAVLSHESAARCIGIELVHRGAEHVTVPRSRTRVALPGWRVHRHVLSADDVEVRHGLRVTSPLRTVLDLARCLPHAEAIVAADSALRQFMFTLDVLMQTTRGSLGRGAARLRAVGRAADPAAGSVLESLLRVLLTNAGLAPPFTQFEVTDAGRPVGRVDFCWPLARLVVEADGFAYHSDRESYRRDRERNNELERLGWRVLRFTWEDVLHRPDYVVGTVRTLLSQVA